MAKFPMRLTVSVKESNKSLVDAASRAISREFNKIFPQFKNKIIPQVRQAVRFAIEQTPEYASLVGGHDVDSLKAQFGLTQAEAKVQSIIEVWVNSVDIVFVPMRKRGATYKGGISIRMIKRDWSDVLFLPDATQANNSKTLEKDKVEIKWLEWLLIRGDEVIIQEYEVTTPTPNSRSRTGLAIMRKTGQFSVLPHFSGTDDNNFVTRAFSEGNFNLEKFLLNELRSFL